MPQELDRTYPVARKEYRCNYCGGVIGVGEKYERSTLVGDDGLYVWKAHPYCVRIASHFDMFDDCDDGVTGEYFRDALHEAICHEDGFDLARKYGISIPVDRPTTVRLVEFYDAVIDAAKREADS